MRLVREDLARSALPDNSPRVDWPQTAKFVFLKPPGTLAIGPETLWHQSLVNVLVDDWREIADPLPRIGMADLVFGHIEWEEDGVATFRDHLGASLPPRLAAFLESTVEMLRKAGP
jgi:hypothetical protein